MSNTFKFGAGKWAAKEGSVLAYNSENNNFKPLPFTFTRASTATRVNESGLIESVASGVPRIDFLDNADGHLLLEPSRTNLITYSSEFDNANWSKTGSVVIANQAISPSGILDADLIELDANLDRLAQVISSSAGTYTFSFYIKAKEGQSGIWRSRVNGDSTIYIDTNVNDSVWTRVSQTFTLSASGNIVVYPAYRVDGVSTLFNAYIYGAQIELGSYATSYIPTSGAAVTRAKDVSYQIPPSGVINQEEGTLYVEFNVSTGEGIGGIVEIVNSSSPTNRVLLWDASSGSLINLSANFGSKSVAITANNISLGTHKAALTYNSTLTKFFLDGVKIGESQSITSYTGISKIDLENIAGTVNFQQKRIKEVKLYTTALSDSELIALTS